MAMATNKKTAQLEIPVPRVHHYAFAFRFVPQLAFNDPHTALLLGLDMPKGVINNYWKQCGDSLSTKDRVEPKGLMSELITFTNHAVILITMPKPMELGEAYYVAIACPSDWIDDKEAYHNKNPDLRCFVLSKSEVALSKSENAVTLREVTVTVNSALEYGVSTERKAFLVKLETHLGDKIKVQPDQKEGQRKEKRSPPNSPRIDPTARYYVTHEGELRGPFDLSLIEAMVLANQFPAQIPVCKEGEETWGRLPQQSSANRSSSSTPSDEMSGETIGLIIAGGIVALIFLIILVRDISKNGTNHSVSTIITPTTTPDYVAPSIPPAPPDNSLPTTAPSIPVDSSAESSSPLRPFPPASPPEQTDTTIVRDVDGQKYSILTSEYDKIVAEQQRLDRESKRLDVLQKELSEYSDEIEQQRSSLDNTDASAVDSFNQAVARYNGKKDFLQMQMKIYNQNVETSNGALKRLGTPVQ
jgi:hypothetical protein